MKPHTISKNHRYLIVLFYILIIIFIINYIRKIDFSIVINTDLNWKIIFCSFIVRMTGLIISPLSWEILLKAYHGKALDKKKIYPIYAESWMGRYIPGKIAWVGGKILFATQEGVKLDTAIITSFLDSILQVFSSMLVATIMFLFSWQIIDLNQQYIHMLYLCTAIMIFCLFPSIFNKIICVVYKIIKHKTYLPKYWMDGKTIILSTLLIAVAKFFSSAAVAILSMSVFNSVSIYNLLYVMSVNLVATAIGMVALFAPAGLGIKESIQIVLLSNIFSKEAALIIVTLASIQSIAGDLLFFILTRPLKRNEI